MGEKKSLEVRDISVWNEGKTELENWKPHPSEIYSRIELWIGYKNSSAHELFYFYLVTPDGLAKNLEISDHIFLSEHTMIIGVYDSQRFLERIHEILRKCTRPAWEDSALALSKFFHWEYADMEPLGDRVMN